MPIEHLTELQHSDDREGPWKLYIFEADSEYHRGGIWFEAKPRLWEVISTDEAYLRTLGAIARGREVRICDKGGLLVYHAKDGKVLYRPEFWKEIRKAA